MRLFKLMLLLCATILAGTAARAACERRFVVAVNDFEPFSKRVNGRLEGIGKDIADSLSEHTGCPITAVEMSKPTAKDKMNSGSLDAVLYVVRSSEFEVSGNFINFYNSIRELIVMKSAGPVKKTIADYIKDDKVKFGALIGSKSVLTDEEDKVLVKEGRIVSVPEPQIIFQLLEKGRIQATLLSALSADYYVKTLGFEDKVIRVEDNSLKVEIGSYLSKRRISKSEEQMFKNAIIEMKTDGSLLKILTKYVGEKQARKRLENLP